MSPVTWSFAAFVAAGIVVYNIIPKKYRYVVLLLMSLVFYATGGTALLGYIFFTGITTYLSGLLLGRLCKDFDSLEKQEKKRLSAWYKRRKKLVAAVALILNFGLLFLLKYTVPILTAAGLDVGDIVLPLGISFYIFQSTGYVIDTYRGKYSPQKSFAKYLLFVCFFPQMIQGPIGRYDELSKTLYEGNPLCAQSFRDGFKSIVSGLFKKLVIADRASMVASAVIDSYTEYDGFVIAVGVLFYCIQLYCDFSGGIDIMRGVAKLFGVDLAHNFRRPFFSVSLTDFWRRWHITLGSWMKDYLFYPMTLSKPFGVLSRFTRRVFRGRAGKILPTSVATFIIYFIIGVWHGANFKYVVFGIWNGVIITAALLCEPLFASLKKRLHIDPKSRLYLAFCIARTCVIVFFGRYITRALDAASAFDMMKRTLCDFRLADFSLTSLCTVCGMQVTDIVIVLAGAVILVALEYFEEKGEALSARLEKKSTVLTFLYILSAIGVVVFAGFYRSGYISPEFIYKQF